MHSHAAAFLSFCLLSCGAISTAADLPGPVVPENLGIHIHFTDPQPGEVEMLAPVGFRWARRGLYWKNTEKECGKYDFSEYDKLIAALDAHHMRPLLFFGYTNPLYENDHSVSTDEGRAAFVRWTTAAVRHFRNRGILWEMYNEPNNVVFWRPKVDTEQYIKLALAVGKALREAEPSETFIGPASCYIDFPFLEQCFKAGLLEYWSAVTVHPYRPALPETVAADYAKLRKMIDQYAPKGKHVPIYSAEWGYPSVWFTGIMTEKLQGKVLPRELLTNLACGIPLSIWYVWRDNGIDPKDPQDHFGIVRHPYHAGQTPVYEPKPAYHAAKTLLATLSGYRFRERLAVGGPDDYVLAFENAQDKNDVRLAAWTTATESRTVLIPTAAGQYAATDHLGKKLPPLTADAKGLSVVLGDAPVYLVPSLTP